MQPNIARSYLETQVATATPQRLRLMLIEGALRLANRARDLLDQQKLGDATEAIVRCQAIVGELGASTDPHKAPELARQISGLYSYVRESLTQAQNQRDSRRVSDAIQILEIERETWQLVCQRLDHTPMPHLRFPVDADLPSGLSLEA